MSTTLATKTDIEAIRAELVLVKWMLGVVIAISVVNFAKHFFILYYLVHARGCFE